MHLRDGQWGELAFGVYVQSPDGTVWLVQDVRNGWALLQDRHGRRVPSGPFPPSRPVKILVPDEAEIWKLLSEELGATEWGRLEALAAQPTRAAQRKAPLLMAGNSALAQANMKGHLAFSHGVIGDGKSMGAFHAELHHDPEHVMTCPHHH